MRLNNKISIIIPVYNAGLFIDETLKSIEGQTYTDWEVILIDDGSSDDSEDIINSWISDKIKLYKNTGETSAAHARNMGIELATGGYIAFLDADDIWEPTKLERQLDFMTREDAAFAFTSYQYADETGRGIGKFAKVPSKIDYKSALKNTVIFTSTVMIDLEKLSKDEIKMPFIKSEDTATWWKILKSGHIGYGLDEALTRYRRSQGTLSSNKFSAIKRIWHLYRKREKISFVKSAYYFVFYAFNTVKRRL